MNCNGYLDKDEKAIKVKMGAACIPIINNKLDCSKIDGIDGNGSANGGGHSSNCGCDPNEVAAKHIQGHGSAICTKPGKGKSGKKSIWTLTCNNGKSISNRKMGGKCKLKKTKLDCRY